MVVTLAVVSNNVQDHRLDVIVQSDKATFRSWLEGHGKAQRLDWERVRKVGASVDLICARVVRPAGLSPRHTRYCGHIERPSERVLRVWRKRSPRQPAPMNMFQRVPM